MKLNNWLYNILVIHLPQILNMYNKLLNHNIQSLLNLQQYYMLLNISINFLMFPYIIMVDTLVYMFIHPY